MAMRRGSNSKTMASNITFPLDHSTLLEMGRNGISLKAERQYWWPVFARQTSTSTLVSYPDIVRIANNALLSAKDNKEIKTLQNVFQLLVDIHNIEDSSYLQPLFTVVSSEFDTHSDAIALVFLIFDCILKDRQRFSGFTSTSCQTNFAAFPKVVSKNMPKTYATLKNINAFENKYMKLIFIDLFEELVQDTNRLAIINAFLLEGTTVLFKYGVGLIHMYKKQIKQNIYFKTGDDFWGLLKREKCRDSFLKVQKQAFETDSSASAMAYIFTNRYSLTGKSLAVLTQFSNDQQEQLHRQSNNADVDTVHSGFHAHHSGSYRDDDDGNIPVIEAERQLKHDDELLSDVPLHEHASIVGNPIAVTTPVPSTTTITTTVKQGSPPVPTRKDHTHPRKAAPVVPITSVSKKRRNCCC